MFTFTPKSDAELIDLLEQGEGTYQVIKAEYGQDKNNQPMLKLVLKVWDSTGKPKTVYDNLTLAMEWKIKHFCYSCGMKEAYDAGQILAENCADRSGKLKIGVQKAGYGKDGVFYQAKNNVADYIKEEEDLIERAPKQKTDPRFTSTQDEKFEDDIPF
jgi:hypothetical protein